MKFKKYYGLTRKLGFTIIESLVYIFLTTMILAEGISLFISMYKSYIETAMITTKYNNCQNFFINLDSIISEGCLEKIVVDNNYILLSKSDDLDKVIKSNEGKIYVKYIKNNTVQTINTMLSDIDSLEVKRNGKLIYFIVHDKEGKEFIQCI